MGLITGLLTLPLAPVRAAAWTFDRLIDAAERERLDPAVVRAELAELYRGYDEGLIGEEEFQRREDEILARFDAMGDP
ncbi:MAG: gas vesicle protein [Streptosporangiales bacterium]|nr:gas vesicle protein [Streptosporangiales bacterium]